MPELIFIPESKEFELATQEYEFIWNSEKENIISTLETITRLKFQQTVIEVTIYEGPSFSGTSEKQMRLRGSYSLDVKKATLIHELGHRLLEQLLKRIEEIDEHRTLNLFLYDVWNNLYGKGFANRMVKVEKTRKGLYDYESAWNWFLGLSESDKSKLWNKILSLNNIV